MAFSTKQIITYMTPGNLQQLLIKNQKLLIKNTFGSLIVIILFLNLCNFLFNSVCEFYMI